MGFEKTVLVSKAMPELTEEIAIKAIRDCFRDKPFVVLGTGMSCALDPAFGMPALESELSKSTIFGPQESEQERQWEKALELIQNGKGLESALNGVTDPTLLQELTLVTSQILSPIDRKYAWKIAEGKSKWPATDLLKRLVDTLPEADPILHVLTPNYDTLFEHACDRNDICFTNGFIGGMERQTDWVSVNQSLQQLQQDSYGNKRKDVYKRRKHVRLYKVHGSLNYFHHRDRLIENNAWMWEAPEFACRVMITPGMSKHSQLQIYRNELLKSADTEIEKADRFLFLGYGFNDSHLETYIEKKLISKACKALIVTRDFNPRIESLLEQADNLWLVCKLAVEDSDGTRIFNKEFSDWLRLPNSNLWDVGIFASEILGV